MFVSSIAALVVSAAVGFGGGPDCQKPEGLVVHEWGTFTSFSGPMGSDVRHYRTIADNLPKFVQGRFVGDRWLNVDQLELSKNVLRSTHRMETPVVYFHTPKEVQVSVEVRMPRGMITEVYPPVSGSAPAKLETPEIPPGGTAVKWDNVRVVPGGNCEGLALPDAGGSHYAHARETSGATVHVKQGDKEHAERFLFYRGVGDLDLGVRAQPLGNDKFKLEVSHAKPAARAFVVEKMAGKFRFQEYKDVINGTELSLPADLRTDVQLETAMGSALARAGLNEDEAKAMVATWKKDWFGDEGTRILVLLPQSLIEQVLPMTISPSPEKTTRVFVSRLEVLTPERMRWVMDLVKAEATPGFDREAHEKEYRKLGVFRNPAVEMAREAIAREGDGC